MKLAIIALAIMLSAGIVLAAAFIVWYAADEA